ncbi:SapC family protein [Caulobacter mirabilis]|uniref:Peptidase n=1 Tax=Caulobacter mirabilis TaxID=69666 RepID=A0A2D2ATB0_9CAUL|nr:SapC family protein [Caulobacter mirabilis]ATQ41252.1 peptidase [Caulobacter mirabilis]
MATNQAAQSPISGSLLFYTNPEPLSRELHGELAVLSPDKPFAFAAEGHVVPLTVAEFGFAAVSYPIIFGGDQKMPLAVLGVNAGENLFVKDGLYVVGAYTPAYTRRYPFVLAADEAQNRMVVCIERPAQIFVAKGAEGSQPLFGDDGEPSEYTKNAIQFCEDFETERRRTESFVQLLTDLDLFDTREAVYNQPNPDGTTTPIKIAEYFAVSEQKLAALPGDKLIELRDNGALEKIYNHITSLVGWDRLIAIATDAAIQRQLAAANNA